MSGERIPKPAHLGPAYGAQFEDNSVVKAYAHRPGYAPEVVPTLERLIPDEPRIVLDIGADRARSRYRWPAVWTTSTRSTPPRR